MRLTLRCFEVDPDAGPDTPPTPIGERQLEAPTLDAAKTQARRLLEQERRPVRAISFAAAGGLIAYVLPQLPVPEPVPATSRRRRRRRPRR